MSDSQSDLFERKLPDSTLAAIRKRLEETLARLEAAERFPWTDPLDAVHEENRFQRGTDMLGDDGAALWERFDKAMDRLYATQE